MGSHILLGFVRIIILSRNSREDWHVVVAQVRFGGVTQLVIIIPIVERVKVNIGYLVFCSV